MSASCKRVLIVDDYPDAADSLAVLIECHGHKAFVAYDVASGLQLANRIDPDIIFHDLALPDFDGYFAVRALRRNAKFAKTLMIAFSGFADRHTVERVYASGFDLHIAKPITGEALREILAKGQ